MSTNPTKTAVKMPKKTQTHPGGRPTDYSEELAQTICQRIANGESLKRITEDDTMPSRSSVHNWLLKYPEFLDNYEASKALQADVYADEMDDIAHDESVDTQRARLIIDTRKWVAAKLKPKKYGERVEQDITHHGDVTFINDVPRPQK